MAMIRPVLFTAAASLWVSSAAALAQDPAAVIRAPGAAELAQAGTNRPTELSDAAQAFANETFDGNGRTCATCHDLDRFGTITPAYVRALYAGKSTNHSTPSPARPPSHPLFRAIDSDDGLGGSYERLLEHATVRVPIDLPTHEATGLSIRRCDAPAETRVYLHRGNPTVFNVALEEHLMHDGRDGNDLIRQAAAAIESHAEPGRAATVDETEAIATFERLLFSHDALRRFAAGGPPPRLPDGQTESERRGRRFFEPESHCGLCHSGPLLNRTSEHHTDAVGAPIEIALAGIGPLRVDQPVDWCWVNPETNDVVPGPLGHTHVFAFPVPDPGIVIVAGTHTFQGPDGTVVELPNDLLAVELYEVGPPFKIPTLWGTPDTAPYFHDNSAKDLDELLEHYNFLFRKFPVLGHELADQDKRDIVAFLQLLAFERPGGAR